MDIYICPHVSFTRSFMSFTMVAEKSSFILFLHANDRKNENKLCWGCIFTSMVAGSGFWTYIPNTCGCLYKMCSSFKGLRKPDQCSQKKTLKILNECTWTRDQFSMPIKSIYIVFGHQLWTVRGLSAALRTCSLPRGPGWRRGTSRIRCWFSGTGGFSK